MSLTAMWIHGSSVVVESPENLEGIVRYAFGTEARLKRDRECWFHASMPTPVIVSNKRPKLVRAIILFKSDSTARLTHVHIFDAHKRIFEITPSFPPEGDRLEMQGSNTFNMPNLDVYFGLGISFKFKARHEEFSRFQTFISAVGADFEFQD